MEEALTAEELERIEARAGGATPGPWEAGVRYERFGVNSGERPGEGPFSFLPRGRCHCCAETGEAAVTLERDRHGSVYHVHRVAADGARPSNGRRTISSAATMQPVVESCEEAISAGIRPCDAEFISHARTDVPRLVSEVRRLRAAVEALAQLQRSTDAVVQTMARLRDESRRLRAEREETLAAIHHTRAEARRAAARHPATALAGGDDN